jgi:integrase
MMNFAVDRKMLHVNPCRRIKLFEETIRTEHLSQGQKKRLNDALLQEPDWRWRAYFPLLLLTGLRKSELLNLTWDRVDFDKRTLTVVKRKNKKPLEQPLLGGAVQLLAGLPSREAGGYVFPGNRPGQPVINAYDAWQRIRARAGLPELRIHSLRHSFASFLLNAGATLFTVGAALGHRSLSSTQRYAHIEHQTVRAAMEFGADAMMMPMGAMAPVEANPAGASAAI